MDAQHGGLARVVPRRSPSPLPILCGAPGLPFDVRYFLSVESASHHATWIALFFIVAILIRMPWEAHRLRAALVAYAAGVAAELAWRRRCRGAPDGGSYARWRHLAFPLFICGDIALARCGVVQVALAVVASESGAPPAGLLGALYHLAVLVLASRFVTNAAVWMLGHPLRYMLPAQLAIVYHHWRANADACESAVLASPAAAAVTHRVAQALGSLQFGGGLTLLLRRLPALPAEECRTVLAWQQLCLSLAAPLLVAAVAETRLWQQHEEQRRQLGLPPEGGWRPHVFRSLDAWLLRTEWPEVGILGWLHLAMVAWLGTSVLFALAALLAQ